MSLKQASPDDATIKENPFQLPRLQGSDISIQTTPFFIGRHQ
jgi:hypothetical protein